MAEPVINQIDVRSIFTKSNLPVWEYSVNMVIGGRSSIFCPRCQKE